MISNKIRIARKNKGYKQSELALKLNVKNTTISNWEKGISKPDFDNIQKLCDLLDVDANYFFNTKSLHTHLSYVEEEIIKKFRKVDSISKDIINYVLNKEFERNNYEINIPVINTKFIDSYPRLASCGPGEYLLDTIDSVPLEVEFDCTADFAVGIQGNSMEPILFDGQTVLIKKQDKINIGEIGLFVVDGEAYIKELGKNCLISKNKEYAPIHLNDYMNIQCIGKVLDIVN